VSITQPSQRANEVHPYTNNTTIYHQNVKQYSNTAIQQYSNTAIQAIQGIQWEEMGKGVL